MTVLEKGSARLILAPETGGAIAGFTVNGRDVLRPAPAGVLDPLLTGNFPLVPFCNRVPNGRFVFEGREVALAPNLPGHPHALHGQGWRAVWSVVRADAAEATEEAPAKKPRAKKTAAPAEGEAEAAEAPAKKPRAKKAAPTE